MRSFFFLLIAVVVAMAAAACNNSKSTAGGTVDRPSEPSHVTHATNATVTTTATATGSPAAATTKVNQPNLALNLVTLLHPEAVIESRLVSQDGFNAAMLGARDAVIAYDASHPDKLPAEMDLVLVARPSGLRCWLATAKGDLVVPELEEAFGRLPKVLVREGNVGAVQMFARPGTNNPERDPYLPAAWKAAAGPQGSNIDQAIDASWPRK